MPTHGSNCRLAQVEFKINYRDWACPAEGMTSAPPAARMAPAAPAPECARLSQMQPQPRWRQCWSVPNLASFQQYIAYYASMVELEDLKELPVVYHRGAFDHIVTKIPVQVWRDGSVFTLPEAACTAPDCPRCLRGGGGFAFNWVDARWTPECALDLTTTPAEMREESNSPWPAGILRSPRPQHSRTPLLSSSWEFDGSDNER